MQLPAFVDRALAFFGKAEANMTAEAQLAAAHLRISELESKVEELTRASADGTVQITTLTTQLAAAQADVTAKGTELLKLQGELAEAKGKANAVIASQGLAPEQLPPLEPRADIGGDDEKNLNLTQRCERAAKKTKNGARN